MKWTKQRKITGAIVALAAMAFGADQLFFQGGADSPDKAAPEAHASGAAATLNRAAAATSGAGGSAGGPLQPAAILARRLEQAAGESGNKKIGDAFRPPAAWFPTPEPSTVVDKKVEAAPQVDLAAQFKAKHKLIGVMRSGPAGSKQGLAVITGPGGTITVRVGQAIDGAVLQSVEEGSIRLTEAGHDFQIELPKPGISAAAAAQ